MGYYTGRFGTRSAGVGTIGAVNIILGSFGLLMVLLNAAMLVFSPVPVDLSPMQQLSLLLLFAFYSLYLASGIGILQQENWGRILMWAITPPSLAYTVFNCFFAPTMSQVNAAEHNAIELALVFGQSCAFMIFGVWPLFASIFLLLPKIREEF